MRLKQVMGKENIKLNELIKKAIVQGLSEDESLDIRIRTIIKKADQQKRHLTQEEINIICRITRISEIEVSMMQAKSKDLVAKARKMLIEEQPDLLQPKGALYPSKRAEACWNDCWQFLRVIGYAYACNKPEFTSPKGMTSLREVYEKLEVPLNGLRAALKFLKILTANEMETTRGKAQLTNIFEHLREELNISVVKT